MFTIDQRSRTPIYRQIVENVEMLASCGLLAPEERLPSVRDLAMELSINPNTISKAYGELEAKGIIYSVPGKGSFLSGDKESIRKLAEEKLKQKLSALSEEASRLGFSLQELIALAKEAWQDKQDEGVDKE